MFHFQRGGHWVTPVSPDSMACLPSGRLAPDLSLRTPRRRTWAVDGPFVSAFVRLVPRAKKKNLRDSGSVNR